MLSRAFDELPEQIEFHEKLKRELEHGRRKLEDALSKAAKIPIPGAVPVYTEEDRILQIREAMAKRESSKVEAESVDSFKVRLCETPTIFMFELEPKGYAKDTAEGDRVAANNEAFIKRRQKRAGTDWRRDAFTQTVKLHYYEERFQTDPILKEDKECISSDWILYNAVNEIESQEEKEGEVQNEGKKTIDQYQKAVQTTFRVLASNSFSMQQVAFCNEHQSTRKMTYKMDHLWTISSKKSGPVNKICLNSFNPKVVGVGYGDREGEGRALVWHVKNPACPEREVTTERAVTCLQFSRTQPRFLALATRSGSVLLVDIASQPPIVTQVNKEEEPPFPEPLWSVCWYMHNDGVSETEKLLTVGQSGELYLWDPINSKGNKLLAELTLIVSPDPELKVRCQEILREDVEEEDPGEHFLEVPFIGLCIAPSSIEKSEVYVTTDVGAIIRVKTSSFVEGVGWNKLPCRHRLPVLGLHHSPFLDEIFLTHSSDGTVSIWVHGFEKPLLRLTTSDITLYGVESAEWSPSHSSVLASLNQEEVCLWDISRRTDRPVSSIRGKGYATLAFSDQGTNLLIGCKDGSVHVYRLSEMPHRPNMQKEHLEKSLRKALEHKPDLLKGLDKFLKN